MITLKQVYRLAHYAIPSFGFLALITVGFGLYSGLYCAPADYQQGDAFRIMYVHVPAAFLSLGIYSFMGLNAFIFLVWRIKLADMLAASSASIGATYTVIALITGALWGKPMWGTWWIWDARLSSELILLFLYLGYGALRGAIPGADRAAKASAILAIIGLVDIPIIHFSVQWWATLHQGPSLASFSKPSIAFSMLYPLMLMILAFVFFYLTVLCIKVRTLITLREKNSQWLRACLV